MSGIVFSSSLSSSRLGLLEEGPSWWSNEAFRFLPVSTIKMVEEALIIYFENGCNYWMLQQVYVSLSIKYTRCKHPSII